MKDGLTLNQLAEINAELNRQVVTLAVENATIKTMNDCLAEELRGYESDGAFDGPDMHKLWHSHAGALPATDIQFANIQAQGVEKFAANERERAAHWDKHGVTDGSVARCLMVAMDAEKFADHLRKGASITKCGGE